MESIHVTPAPSLAFTAADRDAAVFPGLQPYQQRLLRFFSSIPEGTSLKIICHRGRNYVYATPDGGTMTHQWDGTEFKALDGFPP
jgi:hypothetical protein